MTRETTAEVTPTPEREFITQALERFRKKLLDLSRRNRLLNFKDRARTIRIVDELPNAVFDLVVNQTRRLEFLPLESSEDTQSLSESQELIAVATPTLRQVTFQLPSEESIIEEGSSRFTDMFLQTPHEGKKLESKLRKVVSEHQQIIEETGTSTLYLAIGFLEWFESDESSVSNLAPLLLVPVSIERVREARKSGGASKYTLEYDEQDLQYNISLAQLLKRDFDITLPELPSDEEGVEPEAYFRLVNDAVQSRARWNVRREMAVDFFSFAKLFMYLDLDAERWSSGDSILDHPLILQLFGSETQGGASNSEAPVDLDSDAVASRIPLLLDADSSQHEVIVRALGGKSLVVEGPPGTGKSQTITNLIIAQIEQGKSVLFVAEKLAALQVVKRRLDSVGLSPFVLELHSHKVSKPTILANLRERLEFFQTTPAGIQDVKTQLERSRTALSDYVKLINTEFGSTGYRIFDILWKFERLRADNPTLKTISVSNAESVQRPDAQSNEEILAHLELLLSRSSERLAPWKEIDLSNLNPSNIGEFRHLLAEVEEVSSKLGQTLTELSSIDPEVVDAPLPIVAALLDGVDAPELDAPTPFSQSLTSFLVEPKNYSSVREYLFDLDSVKELEKIVASAFTKISLATNSEFTEVSEALRRLLGGGLGQLTVDQLEEFEEHCSATRDALVELTSDIVPSLRDLEFREPRSYQELEQVSGFLRAVVKGIPSNLGRYVSHQTFDIGFDQAYGQSRAKVGELLTIASRLSLSRSMGEWPSLAEVREAQTLVGGRKGRWFNFLNKELKLLRSRMASWAERVPDDLHSLHRFLGEVGDLLLQVNQFNDEATIKSYFGEHYKGLSSDWQTFDIFLEGLREIRSSMPSNAVLKKVSADFESFRSASATLLTTLETCLRAYTTASDKLYRCIGQELISAEPLVSLHRDTPLEAQLSKLASLSTSLGVDAATIGKYAISIKEPLSSYEKAIASESRRRELSSRIIDRRSEFQNGLGGEFERLTEADYRTTAAWIEECRSHTNAKVADWTLREDSLNRVNNLRIYKSEILDSIRSLKDYEAALTEFADVDLRTTSSVGFMNSNVNALRQRVQSLQCEDEVIFQWGDICRSFAILSRRGLHDLVDLIESGAVPFSKLRDCYSLSLCNSQVQSIFRQYPNLFTFSREEHEAVRAKYQKVDRALQQLQAQELSAELVLRRVPEGQSVGRVKSYTNLGLIRHELQKKKRHIPVRQLVMRAGEALQAMKPCFMMSPLSVAQFVPPSGVKFDVILMDEASQLKPEDCLGAIARGGQLIVVGDSNQLPPTQFFDRICDESDEDDDETSMDDMESILDACAKVFHPTHRLQWHYRSEHEDLIRFSNYHFYNQSLMLFPSPQPTGGERGIRRHFIDDGRFAAGRNIREAETVAQATLAQLQAEPHLSLGIGTFNKEQKDLIQEQIEKLLQERPELLPVMEQAESGEEPFFVKNLENIQGDERDVIFISTTYGPDSETGRVFQRFGPINSTMGWRRLNVIFTRAKKRMEIFTSLRSEDIVAGDDSSRGVRMFKLYLKYAEDLKIVDLGTKSERGPDSDFEVSVGEVIKGLGYEYEANLGVAGFYIDIAVRHPKRRDIFILGIECDGAAYHSSRCARDRDRLREEILNRKGWALHRIWSTDWFRNRRFEIDRLARALAEASTAIAV